MTQTNSALDAVSSVLDVSEGIAKVHRLGVAPGTINSMSDAQVVSDFLAHLGKVLPNPHLGNLIHAYAQASKVVHNAHVRRDSGALRFSETSRYLYVFTTTAQQQPLANSSTSNGVQPVASWISRFVDYPALAGTLSTSAPLALAACARWFLSSYDQSTDTPNGRCGAHRDPPCTVDRASLSVEDLDLLTCLVAGHRPIEIQSHCGLSRRTYFRRLAQLRALLEVTSTPELTARAIRLGLVD